MLREKNLFNLSVYFLLLYVALIFTFPIADNDIWFHLKIGEKILQTKSFPGLDDYSFTSRAHYLDHEWLAQVILYLTYSIGEFNALVFLRTTIMLLSVYLLLKHFKNYFPYSFLLLIPVIYLGLAHASIRPHMFSWLMEIILLILLTKKRYTYVPFLLIVWANMHASFLLAVVVAVFFIAREYLQQKNKKLIWLAAACLLAPMVNPYGFNIYFFSQKIKKYTWFVSEWQPFKTDSVFFSVWIFFVLVAMLYFLFTQQKKWQQVLYLLFFSVLGFTASRFPIVCSIYMLPIIFENTSLLSPKQPKLEKFLLFGSFCLLLVGFIPASEYYNSPALGINSKQTPVYATQFLLKNKLENQLFNDYNFGGYLIWNLYPQAKVFVDGRLEIYAGEAMDNYLEVIDQKNAEEVLDRYKINVFLLRPERKVSRYLLGTGNWELVYFDYNAVIGVRKNFRTELKRINCISPWGNRHPKNPEESIEEGVYLTKQNPEFFGAYKILAFLYVRQKKYKEAELAFNEYLRLNPEGINDKESKEFIRKYSY